MARLPIYQVDAFTAERFGGNPAAVVLMEKWLPDHVMQKIAEENNLAETAFVRENEDGFFIRWMTPKVEVELCGHATLAAAHVIFELEKRQTIVEFETLYAGKLMVKNVGTRYLMELPADKVAEPSLDVNTFTGCFGSTPLNAVKGNYDVLLEFENQEAIETLEPDFRAIEQIDARGVICTAPGNEVDVVSRFFAPQSGINEDPVTGSAHALLTPYWAEKLDRPSITATQLSKRKGELSCTLFIDKVLMEGKAVTYMTGEIEV